MGLQKIRGSPSQIKVLGLLSLPLLAIAVAVMVFAFSAFSTLGTAHAADEVTSTLEVVQIDSAITDLGLGTTSLAPDAAIVTEEVTGFTPGIGTWTRGVTFDNNVITTTILATDGTIAGGTDPGTRIAAATTFDNGVNSTITDYSAIPIVGDGTSMFETFGIAIAMITIGAILVIGTFTLTRLTRRQLRRAGQPNIGFEGDGTDFRRQLLEMGRVALGSVLGVARTVWQFATGSTTDERTQATTRSSTA